MKFICLGHLDPAKIAHYTPEELEALMAQCRPHLKALYESGHLVSDAGLEQGGKVMRRVGGKVKVTDGPFAETKELVGGVFIIEAKDMDEAVKIAALHPTTAVPIGEELGWRLDVRPLHHFKMGSDPI